VAGVGIFLTCKYGIRALLASGGGSVVSTASPPGLFGNATGFSAYSARMKYFKENDQEREALTRLITLGRPGEADVVASVTLFLASDEASYVTGAAWVTDGGMTAV